MTCELGCVEREEHRKRWRGGNGERIQGMTKHLGRSMKSRVGYMTANQLKLGGWVFIGIHICGHC